MSIGSTAALLGSNPHTRAHSLGGSWSKAGPWMTVGMCVVPLFLFAFFWWYTSRLLRGGLAPKSEPRERPESEKEPTAVLLNKVERARLLREGIATKATIVSMTPVRELARGTDVYAIVYRIRLSWRRRFRVTGAEVLTDSDPRDLRVREGESVEVRFDPATREVVVVGLDSEEEKWARLFRGGNGPRKG